MEEKIRAANMQALRHALPTMEIWEEGKDVYVKPSVEHSSFLVKSTVDRVASAVTLFGFSGYMISVDFGKGLLFKIW